MKKIYEKQLDGHGVTGRPSVRWIDRIKEYVGGMRVYADVALKECMKREN